MEVCPKCESPVQKLLQIDSGMRLALQSGAGLGKIPDQVCPQCYDGLTRHISKGVQLRIEAQVREKKRAALWKGRMEVIKQARDLMSQKAYSEAAICYEKYLRVLEIVYDQKLGELNPEIFNKSKRSKELTLITSVYWDLLRIYDMSPKSIDRQRIAAAQLAKFVNFSTIYPDIIRRAEDFVRAAKRPEVVRGFLKSAGGIRGKCFIATAVYGNDPYAPEVMLLRCYRDLVLRKSSFGRAIICLYYRLSPPIAATVNNSTCLQKILRPCVRYCAERLGKFP